MTTELEKIKKVVEQTIATNYEELRVVGVKVRPDVGCYDHDILRIWVVVEEEPEEVDIDKLVPMIRYLRPKLREIGQEAFPVISYMSKSDAYVEV